VMSPSAEFDNGAGALAPKHPDGLSGDGYMTGSWTTEYAVIALVAVLVLIAVARFELLCFNDLAQRSDRELNYLSRAGWAVMIALLIPLGGICYLYYGRPR
jgi:hypothetical protein